MKLAAIAFAAALLGCAGQFTPTVARGAKVETMKQVQAALNRGGHICSLDDDGDLICDADKKDAVTVVVSFHTGPGGLHLAFLSAFPWKQAGQCNEMLKAVNQFNADAFSYHAVCTDKGLVLLTMLVVPETGLTDHDLQAFLNWWGPGSIELASKSPMAAQLK
jgi:hypothetical protein